MASLDDDADARARARVGSVLDDKWMLERLLGVGGMAAVYAARHRNGARAAVKVLHPDLARHAEVRERFQREGYAANQVGHPGAVKVMDDDVVASGPDAGAAYLVMELLEGQSLQDRLEQGPPMGEADFLELADAVLDVLCAAHERGVVHRDLKPENLFLLREAAAETAGVRVKVLDFGLARLLQGQAITTYGLALGTPSFMSPEQASGRLDEIDGRTDLFSLAATGFRMRTGRRIHEGANAVELVTKMANIPAPPIRSVEPDVSAPFARVIDRALKFRRAERYGSAREMQDDVRRALAELEGVGPTQLAVPSAPSVAEASELPTLHTPVAPEAKAPVTATAATIQISSRDLEPGSSESGLTADGQPVARPASSRRKRRGSLLPWATMAVFAAIGVGLWADAREAGEPDAADHAAPASVARSEPATATALSNAARAADPSSTPSPPRGATPADRPASAESEPPRQADPASSPTNEPSSVAASSAPRTASSASPAIRPTSSGATSTGHHVSPSSEGASSPRSNRPRHGSTTGASRR